MWAFLTSRTLIFALILNLLINFQLILRELKAILWRGFLKVSWWTKANWHVLAILIKCGFFIIFHYSRSLFSINYSRSVIWHVCHAALSFYDGLINFTFFYFKKFWEFFISFRLLVFENLIVFPLGGKFSAICI